MFPTPPELREDFTIGGDNTAGSPAHNSSECPCGCANAPEKLPSRKKIKVILCLTLVSMISMVGLNAYQRDKTEPPQDHHKKFATTFNNPAGSIQAAETTFPTLTPLNEMQVYSQTPVYTSHYSAAQPTMPHYPVQSVSQYNEYVANYRQHTPNCLPYIDRDQVGQRLKRFVTR